MTASRRRNRYALLSVRALRPTFYASHGKILFRKLRSQSLCDPKIRPLTFYHLSVFAPYVIQAEKGARDLDS